LPSRPRAVGHWNAESAAFLLDRFPASAFLWRVNQEVFRFKENAREVPSSSAHFLFNRETLYWDLVLILVVLTVYRARWWFGAALMSHACLYFAAFMT